MNQTETARQLGGGRPVNPAARNESSPGIPDLIPARMINEFAYCPRLAYLEWVQGEWEENYFTADGSFKHRVADKEKGKLPEPKSTGDNPDETGADEESIHATSVWLSASAEGITARIDIIENDGGDVVPVDYKRGPVPDNPEQSWISDRVQLCAQGLVLMENGYTCSHGVLYYIASKTRITIPFDDEMIHTTRTMACELRALAEAGTIPPPLVDSPKCNGCSLAGICLPDEVNLFAGRTVQARADHPDDEATDPLPKPELRSEPAPWGGYVLHTNIPGHEMVAAPDDFRPGDEEVQLRRLVPPRDDSLPLYVQEQGAYLSKRGENLEITKKGERLGKAKIFETPQVSLFGNVQVSTQALKELCYRGIPICFFSTGGWFYGMTQGMNHKNIELRQRQYAVAADAPLSTKLARKFVSGKIANCRTLLRRNHSSPPPAAMNDFFRLIQKAENEEEISSLLGIEGAAARAYFQNFSGMLKPRPPAPGDTGEETGQAEFSFDFNGRNRRPPADPVNAMLSYAYSLLVKDLTVTAMAVGLDPLLGFYHQPRYGRPALALDLMEEFRPIIADSIVLWVINNGVLKPSDFIKRGPSVAMKDTARKKFIKAYESRLSALVTHPIFGYRISYRRILQVQTRLLARYLLGEIPDYPPFKTR